MAKVMKNWGQADCNPHVNIKCNIDIEQISICRFTHLVSDMKFSTQKKWVNSLFNLPNYVVKIKMDEFLRESRRTVCKARLILLRQCLEKHKVKHVYFGYFYNLLCLIIKEKNKDIEAQGWNLGFNHNINLPLPLLETFDNVNKFISSVTPSAEYPDVQDKFMYILRSLILSGIKIYRIHDPTSILLEIASLINQFDLVSYVSELFHKLAPTLAHVIGKLREETIVIEAQGDDEFTEGFLTAMINLFSGLFANKTLYQMKLDDARVRRLTGLWRTIDSFSKLFDYFSKVLEYVVDYLWSWISGIDITQVQLAKLGPRLEEWVRDVLSIYNNEGKLLVTQSLAKAKEVKNLMRMGAGFKDELFRAKVSPQVMNLFNGVYGQCKELYEACNALITNDSMRNPPLVIHMFGGSGIGKSQLCQFLVIDLAKNAGLPKSNDLTYVRTSENEFWDNYRSQFAVLYDDIFQAKELTTRCNEAIEVIRAGNNMQYPLHMASLLEKGTAVFDSKVIIMTSNERQTREIGISEPIAFWRRRDIVVEVRPRPLFARNLNGKIMLDKQKVFDHFGQRLHWDVYEFYLCDNLTSQIERVEPMSYDEFAKYCCHIYETNDISGAALHKSLDLKWEAQGCCEIYHDCCESVNHYVNVSVDIFRQTYNEWYNSILTLVNKHPWFSVLCAVVSGLSAFGLAYYWAKFACNNKEIESENNVSGDAHTKRAQRKLYAESNVSGDPHTKRFVRTIMVEGNISGDAHTKRMARNLVSAEGSVDINACQWMQSTLIKNVVKVSLTNAEHNFISMNATFIKGRLFIVPKHFFSFLDNTSYLTIETHNGDVVFERQDIKVEMHPTLDLASCEILRKNFANYPDIVGNFIHESDLNNNAIVSGALLSISGKNTRWFNSAHDIKPHGKLEYVLDNRGQRVQCLNVRTWGYVADTQKGSCGAPLVVFNSKINNKIIGIHIAGAPSHSEGYSCVITQETIKRWLDLSGQIGISQDFALSPDESNEIIESQGCFSYLGRVGRGRKVHLPTKTSIIPSPLYETLTPIVTRPAVLSVKRNGPLIKGVRKYFSEDKMLDKDILNQVGLSVLSDFSLLNRECAKVLDLSVAINGIVGHDYIKPIDFATSPGYPYVFERDNCKGKTAFFEGESGCWVPKTLLADRIVVREKDASSGIVTPTIWIDNMKDERRPLQKVLEEKTRLFVSAPLDYTLVFRRYFLGFASACMERHNDFDVAVGINPHGLEWTQLAWRLNKFGSNSKFIAGDFSSFDGSLSYELIMFVCHLIDKWYNDDYSLQRLVLFESIASAYHICGEHVYRVFHGNPSGNPFTAIMNSICNMILIRYSFLKLGIPRGLDASDMEKQFVLVVYGDDNVIAVNEMCPWFNGKTIAGVLKEIGMIYTSANKLDEMVEYIPWCEVSFLKRKFYYHHRDARYSAPLDVNSINEMINWIRQDVDPWYSMRENLETVLIESFHHGENFFNSMRYKINEQLTLNKQPWLINTYRKYWNRWIDNQPFVI